MLRDAGFKHVQSFSDEASVGDFDMSSVFMLLWTISGAVILPSIGLFTLGDSGANFSC